MLLLKKLVIILFNKFLIFGGNAANVSKLKNLGIIGSICEKDYYHQGKTLKNGVLNRFY